MSLTGPTFSITLPDWLMPIVFFVSLLIFGIHFAVLAYHWFAYNNDRKKTLLTLTVYGVGGGVCLLLMAFILSRV